MSEADNDIGNDYQIMVVNIRYGNPLGEKRKPGPEMATINVPEAILKQMGNWEKFLDVVEQFAYNTVSRKYGYEVSHCQIYLPFDEEDDE